VITAEAIARLHSAYPGLADAPVAPFIIDGQVFDTDTSPVVMGVVNLSRDSTYRESIAVSTESAVRKARLQVAEGAHLVDIGAESSRADAARVDARGQIERLVPVIEQCRESGVSLSIESYEPDVVRACLRAGAGVLNLTGSDPGDEMLAMAAESGASVVMCFVPGVHVRDGSPFTIHDDPIPPLLEYFGPRIERARALGVTSLALDPGLGFFYGAHVTPREKYLHQAQVLMHSFRLRGLGFPVCQIMPHAFDLFEERYRLGEPFFTVLARLGGVGVFRVHEVRDVARVLRAMGELSI
jgi:dihydropteroate synthase